MLFKGGKGTNKDKLSNNRFIHIKLSEPCLSEALVVEGGLKEPLLLNSSRFQVDGQPAHRPEELQVTTFHTSRTVLKERGGSKATIGKEQKFKHQRESESN